MANVKDNVFVLGQTPNYAVTSHEEESFVMGCLSRDTMTGLEEDPFVLGRMLLAFIAFELIIGLGVFKYFQ